MLSKIKTDSHEVSQDVEDVLGLMIDFHAVHRLDYFVENFFCKHVLGLEYSLYFLQDIYSCWNVLFVEILESVY